LWKRGAEKRLQSLSAGSFCLHPCNELFLGDPAIDITLMKKRRNEESGGRERNTMDRKSQTILNGG